MKVAEILIPPYIASFKPNAIMKVLFTNEVEPIGSSELPICNDNDGLGSDW
jgi:hypothetical protein